MPVKDIYDFMFNKDDPKDNGRIWTYLAEKAWAKMNMSYNNPVYHNINDVISFMTGLPSYPVDLLTHRFLS